MQAATNQDHRAVDEFTCAAAVGWSVHTVRKDRAGKRRLPFYRIGRSVRYNLDRVFEALREYEVGGPASFATKPRR
ncbi:hypothetical protein [Ideonella sp. A 288]|uniref:hypothetical protein n=1 Tax=Ideonella sp. A 288 TaxID=1962181 RepID=UPI000B4B19CB|nr:hypothetical protein [Ideonella sp. A 288]